jgi:DNA-binding CsgD family transcriptional regulator
LSILMPPTKTSAPNPKRLQPGPAELLERGRACYERHEWDDAFELLSLADRSSPLDADDLHRLAWSAGLTARDEEMLAVQERLYHARLAAGQCLAAARAAFWLGFRLFAHGELGRAGGWLGRAQRLVEQEGCECVEQGYLLLPAAQKHLNAGEPVAAQDAAARAAKIGERFEEADLVAFARNLQGRALLVQREVDRGLALMDEAMVAAISGELSPVVTGIIYCSAIASCQRVYALDRTREWTAALATWCDARPQLVMFTGQCLVHRAEVMELGGSWTQAVEEARRAVQRCVRDIEAQAAGRAHYQEAEIHRLRGEFEAAETAYRNASRCGVEPQPGLALLRLAQGERDAAASAIRRVVDATVDPLQRTRFLPAYVEITLAVDDLDQARAASSELGDTASQFSTEILSAIAAHARAAVALAEGNARGALEPARHAFSVWHQLGAPYLAARLRVLLGRACAALGDVEGARLELEAAQEVFDRLGARRDLDAVMAINPSVPTDHSADAGRFGLTERELQVLRLIAGGKTNKAIARELSLSEKTVDRHVSNIFTKVNVASRASATAFAYQHQLI